MPWTGWVYMGDRWQLILRGEDRRACARRLRAWAQALEVAENRSALVEGDNPPPPPEGADGPSPKPGRRPRWWDR
jgi:hypothetical protein